MAAMKIMVLHPAAPGQFAKLVRHFLSSAENEVVLVHVGSQEIARGAVELGPRCRQFDLRELAADDGEHKPYLKTLDRFIRTATGAAHVADHLKAEGWSPDVVYSHTGFGLGAFVHNVFPDAIYVKYCEWHYRNAPNAAEFFSGPRSIDNRVGTELLNGPVWWDLMRADLRVAPTRWQRQQFPEHARQSIQVVPDGIDTDLARPDPDAVFTTPDGTTFTRGDRVVTYVGRGADPFRGFAQFLKALEKVQAEDPTLQAIIVGDKLAHYGPTLGTQDYYDAVTANVTLDPARTHFTGPLPYAEFIKVLQVSAVHVYLTAPFVLSWSALEAMSCGCALVASDNPPVWEFIDDGVHGLLAEFDDVDEIAAKVQTLLDDADLRASCGRNARDVILERWRLDDAIKAHVDLVEHALDNRPSISVARRA